MAAYEQSVQYTDPNVFIEAAKPIIRKHECSPQYFMQFRSFFGVSPSVGGIFLAKLNPQREKRVHPLHLLWALMFLKVYATEVVISSLANVDFKTYRKKCLDRFEISLLFKVRLFLLNSKHFIKYFKISNTFCR